MNEPTSAFDMDAAHRAFNDKNECSPKVYRIGLDALARIAAAEAERDAARARADKATEHLARMSDWLDRGDMDQWSDRFLAEKDAARAFLSDIETETER